MKQTWCVCPGDVFQKKKTTLDGRKIKECLFFSVQNITFPLPSPGEMFSECMRWGHYESHDMNLSCMW